MKSRTLSNLWKKKNAVAGLIRLDRPHGTLLLMFPTLWSLLIASEGRPSLHHWAVFILGSFLMRSAGCVMNDMADREFDAEVERTKERPLATRALTLQEAMIVLIVLLTLSFLLVLTLNLLTILLSVAALAVAALYPFAKRFTYLPQMVLGVAFSGGVILAWTAARGGLSGVPFLILLANFFWTSAYDTIYALMDRDDDLRIGVKSTAILFGAQSWLAVGGSYLLTLLFLGAVGRRLGMGMIYYLGLLGAAGWFAFQTLALMKSPARPALFSLFRSHVWVGLIILTGIALNYHFNI